MVMISIHTIMSTTSSCQPHHEIVGKCSSAERVNSRVKTLLGAKPCFSCVMVTELRSLFLPFRTSIWRSYRQKAHRTVERAQFALRNVKKTLMFRALLEDEVGKKCTRAQRELNLHVKEFASNFKNAKKRGWSTCGGWCWQHALIQWFLGSLMQWFIGSLTHRIVEPLIHWFVHSVFHWFLGSLIHSILD